MTRPGIEPWSSGPLANTLPSRPMRTHKGWYVIKQNTTHPTKTFFSVHVIDISVNFKCFALLCKNLMTDLYLSLEHSFWFATNLNNLKMNIVWEWNYFCYKSILNNTAFYIYEKKFCFFLKRFLIFIEWLLYI